MTIPLADDLQLGATVNERIGNTPLLRLNGLVGNLEGISLLAKAEWLNPGGSVKDRAAANMVRTALAHGWL